MVERAPQNGCQLSVYVLTGSPSCLLLSGDSPVSASRSDLGCTHITAFVLELVCEILYAPLKSRVSVLYSLTLSCIQASADSRISSPWPQ